MADFSHFFDWNSSFFGKKLSNFDLQKPFFGHFGSFYGLFIAIFDHFWLFTLFSRFCPSFTFLGEIYKILSASGQFLIIFWLLLAVLLSFLPCFGHLCPFLVDFRYFRDFADNQFFFTFDGGSSTDCDYFFLLSTIFDQFLTRKHIQRNSQKLPKYVEIHPAKVQKIWLSAKSRK